MPVTNGGGGLQYTFPFKWMQSLPQPHDFTQKWPVQHCPECTATLSLHQTEALPGEHTAIIHAAKPWRVPLKIIYWKLTSLAEGSVNRRITWKIKPFIATERHDNVRQEIGKMAETMNIKWPRIQSCWLNWKCVSWGDEVSKLLITACERGPFLICLLVKRLLLNEAVALSFSFLSFFLLFW